MKNNIKRRYYEQDAAASVHKSMAEDSRGYKHCGQAMVEMCICLIPILVVLLGMIFIAGLGISNIRAFIQAKANAELSSRSSNAVGGAGNSIFYWNYGETDNGGDGYPFTADDKIVSFYDTDSEAGTEALITDQLNNPEYSESRDSNEYYFMPTTSLVSIDNDYKTALSAAGLVEGKANNNLNNVFTLDANYSGTDQINSLKSTFSRLFGLDVDDVNLREMRANKAYYPVISIGN